MMAEAQGSLLPASQEFTCFAGFLMLSLFLFSLGPQSKGWFHLCSLWLSCLSSINPLWKLNDMLEVCHWGGCKFSQVGSEDHSQLGANSSRFGAMVSSSYSFSLPQEAMPTHMNRLYSIPVESHLWNSLFYHLKKCKYVFVFLKAIKAGSWLAFGLRAGLYPSLIWPLLPMSSSIKEEWITERYSLSPYFLLHTTSFYHFRS